MKKYSHLIITKIIVFSIVIICFTGVIKSIADITDVNTDVGIISEENYFQSRAYVRESEILLEDLTKLIVEYKNQEHILQGATISESELRSEEERLFSEFRNNSRSYNSKVSEEVNYEKFKEIYADEIVQVRDRIITNDLREYNFLLQKLGEQKDLLYYASDGANVFKSSTNIEKQQFKAHPSYIIFDDYKTEIYPKEAKGNQNLYRITERFHELSPEKDSVYIAFTEEFLTLKTNEWKENRAIVTKGLITLSVFLLGFILSFVYLLIVIGRKSFSDQDVHLNAIDKLYNDINVVMGLGLILLWVLLLEDVFSIDKALIPITLFITALVLILILSIVKHFKNKSLIKHTLLYSIIHRFFQFIGDIYASGSTGVKIVLIVIGYPIIVALTFFMFPVTLGIAAWFTLKRIKSFNTIKDGVEKIKGGDLHHRIIVDGSGEFGRLAANINSINDGLKKAVNSELKSQRLKTELITNVSHDIRTPLTSIITYVDLLKKEKNPVKVEEYIEVLDQKSQRLKLLTDDLFEAAKASSGNIPVNLERIDVVSLITQGLGEVNSKIEALDLAFKFNHPKDKVYVSADGKLLWRSIENLLSNIFKYALRGSRVYIDIEDLEHEIRITFKNISAYELNISADELMERFKRGDESRLSEGSGLGLSIAKSLIDIQKGKFDIQVDGDLFKAMIYVPKYH